jgi:hypothetical protein
MVGSRFNICRNMKQAVNIYLKKKGHQSEFKESALEEYTVYTHHSKFREVPEYIQYNSRASTILPDCCRWSRIYADLAVNMCGASYSAPNRFLSSDNRSGQFKKGGRLSEVNEWNQERGGLQVDRSLSFNINAYSVWRLCIRPRLWPTLVSHLYDSFLRAHDISILRVLCVSSNSPPVLSGGPAEGSTWVIFLDPAFGTKYTICNVSIIRNLSGGWSTAKAGYRWAHLYDAKAFFSVFHKNILFVGSTTVRSAPKKLSGR